MQSKPVFARFGPMRRLGATLLLALAASVCSIRGTQNAVANGDTRTITIKHMHTKEETTVTFKRDGRYIAEGLEKLNWALRDWRMDEPIRMDPRLFDLAWEVQRIVGSEQPFHVVSAYRSPGTNSMLRRRSRAVAKNSQHMLGKAMDFYLPDTPTAKIREAGMRLQRGGVGFYPGAHTPFVHLDAGSVRSWPRMTRDQLARLFPDEKTVHLPADGQPMAGYELAKADILARGGAVAGYAAADLDEGAVISSGRKSLWASLFGGDDEEADARPVRGGRGGAPKQQPAVMTYANNANAGYIDSNASDGGRFAVAAAPAAPPQDTASRPVLRERPEPVAPAAQPQPVLPAQVQMPVAPPPEERPRLIDAPVPLSRPRGLTLPQQPSDAQSPVQIAALPPGAAFAFAPQIAPGGRLVDDQRLVPASLPPRRPGEITPLIDTRAAGQPMVAPLPPSRPGPPAIYATASLGNLSEPRLPTPIVTLGKLVTVTHPLPPGRPGSQGAAPAARTAAEPTRTPIVTHYDADRAGLESLFATASKPSATGKPVTVATAKTKAANGAPAVAIQGPSPAASLGFSQAEPSDAKPGRFSGPAVRSLPTNFIQN